MGYHHGDLPAALLKAVESAVAEYGVSGLSLRDVARRAGVSHGAPAHHFGSKAGLLTAFATDGYELLASTVLTEVAMSRPADEASELAAIGRGYVRFAIAHPSHFEVMFRLDVLNAEDLQLVAASEAAYARSPRQSSGAGRQAVCTAGPPGGRGERGLVHIWRRCG